MIDINTIDRIKKSPIEERIQIIKVILQSLKDDIKIVANHSNQVVQQRFKVRKFSLG